MSDALYDAVQNLKRLVEMPRQSSRQINMAMARVFAALKEEEDERAEAGRHSAGEVGGVREQGDSVLHEGAALGAED